MIERIIKAVKRGNKKRSINITIGAVVGFLLSCTAVMGADEYLWIKNDGGGIKFNTAKTTEFDGTDGTWNEANPYNKNSWDGTTYTNNMTLLSTTNNGKDNNGIDISYGLRLSGDLGEFEFINKGNIKSDYKAIDFTVTTLSKLINHGNIGGPDDDNGIDIFGSHIDELSNNGNISDSTEKAIYLHRYSTIKELNNNGNIDIRYGVYMEDSKINNFTNNGNISSSFCTTLLVDSEINILENYGSVRSSLDLYNESTINVLRNTGTIFGEDYAINNEGGTINDLYNYGILMNSDRMVDTIVNTGTLTLDNFGLIFKADVGKYTATEGDFKNFGKTFEAGGYTIINAKAEGSFDNIVKTESILSSELSGDKAYVLNGIINTLEVNKNIFLQEVNNSVINAYKTAIVMNGNESYLELNNTKVNGGFDGSSPTILVGGTNNFLTIKGDTIVNGDMESTGTLNTLILSGKENNTRSTRDDSMNIFNKITNFGRIEIENNVTFFEIAQVTGVERITIKEDGTLNLRLQAGASPIDKATHALTTGNTGLTIAGKENTDDRAGTLNFMTNGIGTNTVIDMGGINLENVKLSTSSIIDEFEVLGAGSLSGNEGDIKLGVNGDLSGIYKDISSDGYIKYKALPNHINYDSLNKIYQSSITHDNNVNALREMIYSTGKSEQWLNLLSFAGDIYTGSPYSYSSELSRKSMGMFRDIVTENSFRPDLDKWLIMGGLTHADSGTKDTYYGRNYHGFDTGTSNTKVDMKLTGAYMLAKYGYSENISLGVTVGGNKSEAEMSMSKVKGNSGYIGAFAENYKGNLTLKAGAGIQYSEYDADRRTLGESYSEKYSDMAYDIYLNGRYSHNIGTNLFLEPYGTLSYTYVDQNGIDEGSEALAIKTDSKSFDYTVGKMGVDLKKVIPHEKGKSTLSAGVSYTKILDGADEEFITGRFKGGTDFDILVAHKNEHSIGLNAKYTLELEDGILFDVKGTYAVERDSHNGAGKNKTKGEWIVGTGLGYKF
ncbi:autotransporter outer membrane beta-barrel domain-containing protein [Fusobacterium ulcerans]|uniref:autotransporter family protein n=1 Tax=Fusobacterium ulcerans TaxID=861 RepID=UPI00102FCF5F|nr:autotransporter outer membrane beta-barrel domain-containing protein [Fusobacterium ulcerans]